MTAPGGPSRELAGQVRASRGHFRYESGHHGDLWLDLDALFLRPVRMRRHAESLATVLADYQLDAVCGPLVGGAFLAQTVAEVLDVQFLYAERISGRPSPAPVARPETRPRPRWRPEPKPESKLVDYRVPDSLRSQLPGRRVAVVDDAVNAGSALGGTCRELRAAGANPVATGALLALGNAATITATALGGLPFHATATLPRALWAASECPLCTAGTPLHDALDWHPPR